MADAGDQGERGPGNPPSTWPWYVRGLAVACVFSHFVGIAGFLILVVMAAWIFAWRPERENWLLIMVAAACACPAACAIFRRWLRSWGKRHWPAAPPDAPMAAAQDAERLEVVEAKGQNGGRYFFLGLGLLCVAGSVAVLAVSTHRAVAESRLALRPPIKTIGTVLETRIVGSGKSRWKEGLVEYAIGGQLHRQWIRILHIDRDRGATMPLWYHPAMTEATDEAPNPHGYWLQLPPFCFTAVLGLYLSAAMTRLLLKGEPLTSGPPYPDLNLPARIALLAVGGLGAMALVVLLFIVLAFATLDPSAPTPTDRWHAIQVAIGSNRFSFLFVFLLLTCLLTLCWKAILRDPQMAHNTGRHMLASSLLAMTIIAIAVILAVNGLGLHLG